MKQLKSSNESLTKERRIALAFCLLNVPSYLHNLNIHKSFIVYVYIIFTLRLMQIHKKVIDKSFILTLFLAIVEIWFQSLFLVSP